MRSIIDFLGGRKFVLALCALFLVVFAIDLPGQQKAEIVTWLVGLFSAANAVSKKFSPPSPPEKPVA